MANNRNDSLKTIVSSFNLLPNLARDFKTIRRSLSKITGIKPSITEDSKTKDGKGISPTLVGADDKKKSEGGGLLGPLLLLKLASFGQKKKFLRSPVGKAFRKFRKVNKSIKLIQKTLLNVVKKVFSPKNIIKILGKLALPLVIAGSLFEGLTAGFAAYKETGSIWEAYKATVGGVVEFLTFGLIDKEMVGKFYQGIADFVKPVRDAIGKIYTSIKEYVSEKVDGVKTFFGMKIEPKVTKPVDVGSKEELEKQAKAQEELGKQDKAQKEIEKAKKEEIEKQYEGEDEIVRKRLKLREKSAKKLQEEEDERRAKEGKPTPAPAPAPAAAAPAPAAAAPTAPAKAPSKDEKPLEVTGVQATIVKSLNESGVTSPKAHANVLATVKAESNFKVQSENLLYSSAQRIMDVFGKKRIPSAEFAEPLVKNPEALANEVYKTTDGNSAPGDGFKYRGRGFIQHTGKNQYAAISKFTGADVLSNPDLLNSPEIAAKAIPWFLLSYKGLKPDDVENMSKVNKAIAFADPTGKKAAEREASAQQIQASMSGGSTGGQVASASTDVASGQRQQAKPSTPVNINASTTNNTKINKNEMAAASKPQNTAGMLAARAA